MVNAPVRAGPIKLAIGNNEFVNQDRECMRFIAVDRRRVSARRVVSGVRRRPRARLPSGNRCLPSRLDWSYQKSTSDHPEYLKKRYPDAVLRLDGQVQELIKGASLVVGKGRSINKTAASI
jgi:hypothetical protein